MKQQSYVTLHCAPPCFSDIEKMIKDNLLHDWAIRIEHIPSVTSRYAHWQQWGTILYAVDSPSVVLEALLACNKVFPEEEIRINAEKSGPDTKMIYWVYCKSDDIFPSKKLTSEVKADNAYHTHAGQTIGSLFKRIYQNTVARRKNYRR